MPHSEAEQLALLDRRRRVADAYLRGHTQHQIAAAEGVNQGQISRDLAALRREWRASAGLAFGKRQALELAKLDRTEAAAWEGWQRSCQDAETRHARTTKGRTMRGRAADGAATVVPLPDLAVSWISTEGQAGDPRFLDVIQGCVRERCKILGVAAAQKVEHSGPEGGAIPHEHTLPVDARRAGLLGLLATLGDRARNGAAPAAADGQ